MNLKYSVLRKQSQLKNYPIIEVVLIALITALINYNVHFLRGDTSKLIGSLFQRCDYEKPNR